MALTHRRRWDRGEDDWHFHPECPDWPPINYKERADQPPQEELCLQCQALRRKEKHNPDPRSVTVPLSPCSNRAQN
jgi:hypothetical protein